MLLFLENALLYPAPKCPEGDWEAPYLERQDVTLTSADGTKLTIDVEFTVPEALASRLPSGTAFESLKKAEADLVTHNLKAILEH